MTSCSEKNPCHKKMQKNIDMVKNMNYNKMIIRSLISESGLKDSQFRRMKAATATPVIFSQRRKARKEKKEK